MTRQLVALFLALCAALGVTGLSACDKEDAGNSSSSSAKTPITSSGKDTSTQKSSSANSSEKDSSFEESSASDSVVDSSSSGDGENASPSNGAYTRVDVNGNADADGEYMLFGQYPQTKITDTALISTLNTAAGNLPTDGNNQAWTSYGYYQGTGDSGTQSNATDFMWYIDLDTDEDGQDDYRGVYFTSYRPSCTHYVGLENWTNQDNWGYTISEVYWFSYDPILWKIMKEESGNATLLCEMIIDSQDYNYTDGSRTENEQTIYANNYAESTIRAWLNDEFYNTAFNSLQKAVIVTVEVDNSAATTHSSTNEYACENTNDNVWLLSYQEAKSITGSIAETAERRKNGTDYAKSQGLWRLSSTDERNYWWLRSPYGYSGNAHFISYWGDISNHSVSITLCGVAPALQIRLS